MPIRYPVLVRQLEPSLVSVSLQKGSGNQGDATFARVQLFDANKQVIQDRLVKLQPVQQSTWLILVTCGARSLLPGPFL